MQAIKDSLMREICRPNFLNEIKNRFNNSNSCSFRFGNLPDYGEVRAMDGGVISVFFTRHGWMSYTAGATSHIGSICEGFAFVPSAGRAELVARQCYDAPFDARVFRETCPSYQPSTTPSNIPHTIGVIVGIGSAVRSYQNFRDGNKGRAAIWAAVSVTSIALPFFA